MDDKPTAATATDERFAWTSELIGAVLALRFKDAAIATEIDGAKGNEAKRKAWGALAARLQQEKGVALAENKLRRVLSKWQSQHRSWVQAVAAKGADEWAAKDRPPSYMPVLHRYFGDEAAVSGATQLTSQSIESPGAKRKATSQGIVMAQQLALPAKAVTPSSPRVQPEQALHQPARARAHSLELSIEDRPAQSEPEQTSPSPVPHVKNTQTPLPIADFTMGGLTSFTGLLKLQERAIERDNTFSKNLPVVISQEEDEDPTTSQDTSQTIQHSSFAHANSQDMPKPKQQKNSHPSCVVIPERPKRMSLPQPVIQSPDTRIVKTPGASSEALQEIVVRITEKFRSVHQEQISLQKKHFEQQQELQRAQFQEQFTLQRKQVEVIHTVLESLQGCVSL